MAGSGILWVDNLFNSCVLFLVQIASLLGVTYEELNVYLFCICVGTSYSYPQGNP